MNENKIPCRYVKYEVSKAINPDSALVFKNLKFPHKRFSSSLKLCPTNFENKRSVIFWS